MSKRNCYCSFLISMFILIFMWVSVVRAQQYRVLDPSTTRLVMENPDTINKLILDAIRSDSPLRKLIDEGTLKLRMLEPVDENADPSLGLEYNISKDLIRHDFSSSGKVYNGISLNFSSRGEIAFDQYTNPINFTDTDFSLMIFRSSGGAIVASDEIALRLNQLEDEAAEAQTVDELLRSEAAQEAARIICSHLSTQLYIELAADGGLEANQSLTDRQYYYGAHLGIDVKAWNPDSALARFNIFDYPFALSRYLTGSDLEWRPRGSALPILLVGIDRVRPDDLGVRAGAGDQSDFDRFRFEASYRTLAAAVKEEAVYFEADFRYYYEFDPSNWVISRSLYRYSWYNMSLLLPGGVYLSYSRGKLPLGEQNKEVYSAGLAYSF